MRTETAPALDGPAVPDGPHVVVGVDGSGGGWSALGWARDEIAAAGGRLTVCHAGPPPPGHPASGAATMAALELVDPTFARFVHQTRQRLGGQRVALRIAAGQPAHVLAEAAHDADMIVIGAPEPPRHHGSTAVQVATAATVPVIVVSPVPPGSGGPFAGHVLACVAGSGADPSVLDVAFRYAVLHRLPVAAVHVTSRVDDDYWFDEQTLETHFVAQPHALEMLATAVDPLRVRYPRAAIRLGVLAGEPLSRLLQARRGTWLAVVGRRARWFANRLPGSVTHAMTTVAEGPLAIVPAGWVNR